MRSGRSPGASINVTATEIIAITAIATPGEVCPATVPATQRRRPAWERLARDPVTALLVRAALGHHRIADFFTIAPTGEGEPTLGEDLARMRERSPEIARADLTVSLGGPLPASLHRSDLPERAADLLEWVWTKTCRAFRALLPNRSRRNTAGGPADRMTMLGLGSVPEVYRAFE